MIFDSRPALSLSNGSAKPVADNHSPIAYFISTNIRDVAEAPTFMRYR